MSSTKTIVMSDNTSKTVKNKHESKPSDYLKRKLLRRTLKHVHHTPSVDITSNDITSNDITSNEFTESIKILENTVIPIHLELPVELALNETKGVPYSNLKNGNTKPTYRDWTKTMKNVRDLTNDELSEREKRIQLLREKLKQKKPIINSPMQSSPIINSPIISSPIISSQIISSPVINNPMQSNPVINSPVINNQKIPNPIITNSVVKRITTTKLSKTYKVGRTKRGTISLLMSGPDHTKTVKAANNELKKHSMTDIKQYLRDHNLLQRGSNTPNDVARKLYESDMMTGEVTNST